MKLCSFIKEFKLSCHNIFFVIHFMTQEEKKMIQNIYTEMRLIEAVVMIINTFILFNYHWTQIFTGNEVIIVCVKVLFCFLPNLEDKYKRRDQKVRTNKSKEASKRNLPTNTWLLIIFLFLLHYYCIRLRFFMQLCFLLQT